MRCPRQVGDEALPDEEARKVAGVDEGARGGDRRLGVQHLTE